MSDAYAAIEEHVAAFNAHDTERVLAGLAPTAIWRTGVDAVRGRAALAELFDDGLWQLGPSLELVSLLADGDRAAAELIETISVDGAPTRFAIAAFFDLSDGLIDRGTVYREGSAEL